jgi:DNA-binding CsgD family transcriptional regulator
MDEIDYGMVIVDPGRLVVHANHRARAELHRGGVLFIENDRLVVRQRADAAVLDDALAAAAHRGLRRLIDIGDIGDIAHRLTLAIVPLPASDAQEPPSILMLMGRSRLYEDLSVQSFARANGLTPAENRVLGALCAGEVPIAIARSHGVTLATVRTQVGSIRAKTGARSVKELIGLVAALPPMVSALKSGCL